MWTDATVAFWFWTAGALQRRAAPFGYMRWGAASLRLMAPLLTLVRVL